MSADPPDPAPLLALGLAVFALPAGSRTAGPGWAARLIRNPAALSAAWRVGDNIGVGCRASRILGLDLDGAEGIAAFAELCRVHDRPEPRTFTVATPHGRHLYFRAEPGCTLPSTSGGTSGLGPAIDTRGPGRRRGGYLIGPGSVVAAGRYEVAAPGPIRPLPDWIARLLAEAGPAPIH